MHLVLVRHGQTDPNPTTPDWNLSARGVWEVQRLGARLRDTGITHIISSPLRRALATAHSLAMTLDHRPVEVWLDLREGFDHAYPGISRAELLTIFPRAALPVDMPDAGWTYPGDTRETFVARCHHVLDRLQLGFAAGDRVLVVTHGGVANYLLHAMLHLPPHAPVWFDMAPGAVTSIHFVPQEQRTTWPLYPAFEAEILTMNDTGHLSEHG